MNYQGQAALEQRRHEGRQDFDQQKMDAGYGGQGGYQQEGQGMNYQGQGALEQRRHEHERR